MIDRSNSHDIDDHNVLSLNSVPCCKLCILLFMIIRLTIIWVPQLLKVGIVKVPSQWIELSEWVSDTHDLWNNIQSKLIDNQHVCMWSMLAVATVGCQSCLFLSSVCDDNDDDDERLPLLERERESEASLSSRRLIISRVISNHVFIMRMENNDPLRCNFVAEAQALFSASPHCLTLLPCKIINPVEKSRAVPPQHIYINTPVPLIAQQLNYWASDVATGDHSLSSCPELVLFFERFCCCCLRRRRLWMGG